MKTLIILAAIAFSVTTMASTHSCGGSNPHWAVTITDTAITTNGVADSITSKAEAVHTSNDWAFVAKTTAGATATVIGGECTNGLYNSIYLRHIIYTTSDGAVLYGCCDERD